MKLLSRAYLTYLPISVSFPSRLHDGTGTLFENSHAIDMSEDFSVLISCHQEQELKVQTQIYLGRDTDRPIMPVRAEIG